MFLSHKYFVADTTFQKFTISRARLLLLITSSMLSRLSKRHSWERSICLVWRSELKHASLSVALQVNLIFQSRRALADFPLIQRCTVTLKSTLSMRNSAYPRYPVHAFVLINMSQTAGVMSTQSALALAMMKANVLLKPSHTVSSVKTASTCALRVSSTLTDREVNFIMM